MGVVIVGVTGVEPVTSTLSVWRSNQLSYTPVYNSTLGTTLTPDLYHFRCLYLHRISRMPKRAHTSSSIDAYCYIDASSGIEPEYKSYKAPALPTEL